MNTITFDLDKMTPTQLAHLYKTLVSLHIYDDAKTVYQAGIRNCGDFEFAMEVARVKS